MRFFNTAGRCRPELHYMLPPVPRLKGIRQVVDQQEYFVLHAPRQSGKSTALFSLAEELTRAGRYAAILVSMETGAGAGVDPAEAEAAILADWRLEIQAQLPRELHPPPLARCPPADAHRSGAHRLGPGVSSPSCDLPG